MQGKKPFCFKSQSEKKKMKKSIGEGTDIATNIIKKELILSICK